MKRRDIFKVLAGLPLIGSLVKAKGSDFDIEPSPPMPEFTDAKRKFLKEELKRLAFPYRHRITGYGVASNKFIQPLFIKRTEPLTYIKENGETILFINKDQFDELLEKSHEQIKMFYENNVAKYTSSAITIKL